MEGGQKRRKLALCFGALERDIRGIAEQGHTYDYKSMSRPEYTAALVRVLLKDPALASDARSDLELLLEQDPQDELLLCNRARNYLLSMIGTVPAEWDLIIAPHSAGTGGRDFHSGMMVYAEDIRSPFNLGSVFRSAEALGAERILLSPFCCSPDHPRAKRSAMGCIGFLPWERRSLEDIPKDVPVFALETGGVPADRFVFPDKGIAVIGSEELGVSPAALARCTYGRVSIPMTGIKASLNVGVAAGILLYLWGQSLRASS